MGGVAGLEAAVSENVRKYRAIASLCRQAAAFRPAQKASLLQQAEDWEHRAMSELQRVAITELEARCEPDESSEDNLAPRVGPQVDTRWWLPRREGLFAGLQA